MGLAEWRRPRAARSATEAAEPARRARPTARTAAAIGLVAVAAMTTVGVARPAGATPRDDYESSIGRPPATLVPPGHLGHVWTGAGTGVSGTASVSRGELVIEDRPFDDTGADTVPGNGGLFGAGTGAATLPGLCGPQSGYRYGDFSYPSDAAYGGNAADLIEVRLAADAASYDVTFELETLIDPAKTVVGLGIDADGNPATGRPGWAGYEHVVQVSGGAADLDGSPVPFAVDVAANTYEARLPRASLPDTAWRVAPAAGLWDGTSWTDGVVDLGWVPDEPITGQPNCRHDARQSADIAAGTFPGVAVSPARLRAGESDSPTVERGPLTRFYPPALHLGEGTVGQARYAQDASANVYRGTVQPYTIYVPDSYDPGRDNPLILLLHCLTCNHTTFDWASWPGLKALADARGAPIVTPLAYGEGGHYEGEAEVDVFEVLRDVRARYRIDADRIDLTGMSMGALGTYRLGLLYPDLWARALGVGNYTNPECVTTSQKLALGCTSGRVNYFTILDNARDLPYGVLNGALDELTPVTGAREIADRFVELGYPYRYWEYPTQDHNPALHGLTTDATLPWFGDVRRLAHPAAVTFIVDRAMDDPAFGLVHDRAYWLRSIQLAGGATRGRVDATSGRGVPVTVAPFTGSGSDGAGSWSARGLDPVLGPAGAANRLELTLASVSSLAVDVAGAGLSPHERLVAKVTTDGPVRLLLSGWTTTLSLDAGTTEVTLEPGRGVVASRHVGGSGQLPATGGAGAAGVGLGGLALLAAVAARLITRRSRPRCEMAPVASIPVRWTGVRPPEEVL